MRQKYIFFQRGGNTGVSDTPQDWPVPCQEKRIYQGIFNPRKQINEKSSWFFSCYLFHQKTTVYCEIFATV
jgi:hypothetical protein